MSLLAPNGRPVSSDRRTVIEVTIIDRPAGAPEAMRYSIATPYQRDADLQKLLASLRMKLSELGIQPTVPVALGAGVRSEPLVTGGAHDREG